MASAPKKKNAAARAIRAPTKSVLVKAAPRASFVTPETLAEEVESAVAPMAEAQQSFRNAVEKRVADPRAAFAKARTAADEATSAFEVSFAAAKHGAVAINAKGFEALRANADANFDFLKAVFAAKSLADVIALQAAYARKQVETFASQSKDLGALTQKAMADAVEPIKEQVAKSFKIAV
ncbi:MAG TPA: phasin family protein [Roseiarcus sp.]|jgi:phasin